MATIRIPVKVTYTLTTKGNGRWKCGACGAIVSGNARHTCTKTYR